MPRYWGLFAFVGCVGGGVAAEYWTAAGGHVREGWSMTIQDKPTFEWLEFRPRPKKDGLHDSGYRFIALTGVNRTDDGEQRTELHQWSDHVVLYGPTNVDVTADGTIRIMPWSGGPWINRDRSFFSSAEFHPSDSVKAQSLMTVMEEM